MNRAQHGEVLQTHLRRPVCPDLDTAVRSREPQLDTRDGTHSHESNARVKKAANVDAKVLWPRTANPVAAATSCCSEMNISKYRSGNACLNSSAWVELLTSASKTTTVSRPHRWRPRRRRPCEWRPSLRARDSRGRSAAAAVAANDVGPSSAGSGTGPRTTKCRSPPSSLIRERPCRAGRVCRASLPCSRPPRSPAP